MKRYRIAVAGCGGMARTWVEYALARQDAEIVALVDLYEESAKAMAQRYDLTCPTFTELAAALEATDANIVFDVTVPDSHKRVTTTALARGCHVFGEKPMASSLADARELVAAAEQAGRMYAVMQNRRYLRHIRALREQIGAGTIGRVGFVGADFFLGPHFGGFREAMASPLIVDMAIHTFDQARFITGADPVSVYCHEFNPPGSWYEGNASAVCIFEMSDGSVFNYRGSWCSVGSPTSWESSWRISGSAGTAIWDGASAPYCEVLAPTPVSAESAASASPFARIEAPLTWNGKEGHHGCLDEMFAALEEGRPAETVCTDNIKSMAMVFGALESAATGRKVAL